ncbi:MAG: PatB family C-S lyase [Pseudoflavonifractor sp.]
MMYDFDQEIDRSNTTSIKWNKQNSFGVKNGLLPFWIADTDFATLPQIMEAITTRCQHPIIGYSEPQDDYYEAIQGWWDRRHGWKPDIAWMHPTSGVVTTIKFTLGALLQPKDKVLVFTPVYDPFFAAVKNSGCTLVDCPLRHEDNTFHMDFDAMERELKNGVKAVLFCNPHNPIGRVWTHAEMQQLTDLCVKYDVYLLSDEIHADITLGGRKYCTAGSFPQIYDKLIVYTAISKTFNMAGLVSSCTIVPNPAVKQKIVDALDACWMFGPADLAFTAAVAAYNHGDQWVDEQCAYLTSNAEIVKNFCAEHLPKVGVTKQEGTFLMWLDMTCLGKSSDEMTDLLAQHYGLALGNGAHYGKQADGFMRFNIGCTKATLQKGLEQLSKFYADCVK